MEALQTQDHIWQPNVTAIDGMNNTIANGTSPIDPALAACYNLPYGGWGLFFHFLLLWSCFWIRYCRRPFVPWKALTSPAFGIFICASSPVLFMIAAHLSLINTECKDGFV